MPAPSVREVVRVIDATHETEGAGFPVRRPLPVEGVDQLDPFLLIDELGPVDFPPGEALGAPDHPHRGFETVSYVLEGEVEHEDSAGHRGSIRPGDVQWMTAGGGIIHSEEPSKRLREQGGRAHAFQVWINLPARLKMTQPRYQEVPAARIPTGTTADGRARVRVIAGSALGVSAVIDTHTPVSYQDWTLDAGADVAVAIGQGQTTLVYAFSGSVRVGEGVGLVKDGQLAILGDGDTVRLRSDTANGTPTRLLLLAGVPHREPMVHYGPFVMNTQLQIMEAVRDFQSGRMGEIVRTARIG